MNTSTNIPDGFRLDDEGIIVPGSFGEGVQLSYPEDGHNDCFQIEDDSFWFAHRNRIIVELVRTICPDDPIIDVGGGNGFVTKAITDAGFECALLEPGYQGCLNSKKRGVEDVICGSIEDLSSSNFKASGFGLFDVLEHIDDDAGFLNCLHSMANDDAKLFLTVPALPMLWSPEDEFAGHFRRYTRNSLKRLMELSGWKWEHGGYFFNYTVLPVYLRRSLRKNRISSEITESASQDHMVGTSAIKNSLLGCLNSIDRHCFFHARGVFPGSSLAVCAVKS